jgi:hypothetical protein
MGQYPHLGWAYVYLICWAAPLRPLP